MKNTSNILPDFSVNGVWFGPFRLEEDGTLWFEQAIVHLTPRELTALQLLVAHAGRVVSLLQLRRALWGDVHVTADSVPKCLSSLRAKLHSYNCIQTVYKRGYRFTAEVRGRQEASQPPLPRLAILPFSCGYGIPEHLGRALSEEVIARLGRMEHATALLLARDSVFTLADSGPITAQEIGKTLKADLVLAGSLTAITTQFRLRVEMIRVDDGTQIWVEDLMIPPDRTATLELLLVQRLLMRLSPEKWIDASVPRSSSEFRRAAMHNEAWELYLKGHHDGQILQRHRLQDALGHLQQAVTLDPGLTAAKIDIAHLSIAQSLYGFLPPRSVASAFLNQAKVTDEDGEEIPAILPATGWFRFHVDHDLSSARSCFEASSHLPHSLWLTHLRYLFAVSRHRFSEALELLNSALELDPYSPWLHCWLAWTLHLSGKSEECVEQIHRTLILFPRQDIALFYGCMILSSHGQAERSLRIIADNSNRTSHFDMATATHAWVLAQAGYREEAQNLVERMQWLSRERFVMSSFLPAVHIALGNPEQAIGALQTSLEDRCPWFFQMLADPRLKPLHGHPEFEQMRAILPRLEAGLPMDQASTLALA